MTVIYFVADVADLINQRVCEAMHNVQSGMVYLPNGDKQQEEQKDGEPDD
jgi:hypothetical protein